MLTINKTQNDTIQNATLIKYGDIQGVSLFEDEEEEVSQKPTKSIEKLEWPYLVMIKTTDDDFYMYAQSQDEQYLWVHTIIWIIEQGYFKLRKYIRDYAYNK